MKLYYAVSIVILSLGLLSSCAYIEGRRSQQQQDASTPKSTTKDSEKVVLAPTGPATPETNTSPNPAAAASRMLAPLTN